MTQDTEAQVRDYLRRAYSLRQKGYKLKSTPAAFKAAMVDAGRELGVNGGGRGRAQRVWERICRASGLHESLKRAKTKETVDNALKNAAELIGADYEQHEPAPAEAHHNGALLKIHTAKLTILVREPLTAEELTRLNDFIAV